MLRIVSALLLGSALVAQSPLTTTFADNNGGAAGGAVYFELEALDSVGVSITDIDLNVNGTVGDPASFDLYLQPLAAPGTLDPLGSWVGPVTTGSAAAIEPTGTPTSFVLSTPLQLGLGCRYGVAIAGDFAHAYTTGGTGFPLTYTTAELELLAGSASNTPFTGPIFSPRVVNTNLNYVLGGSCPTIAKANPRGTGCVATFASFYELMSPGGFDLNGMILTGTNNGAGFDITLAPGAGVSVPLGATELTGLGDDTSVDTNTFGGTLGLWAGSNGWLATGDGNSTGFVPNIGALLGNPATGVYSWTDLQPNAGGSGQVYYDEPSATVGRLTYDGVFGWGTTEPNFLQITYDTATGDFSIEWGATSANNPEDWLVGYSPGGPSDDPGPTDISATAPFSIGDSDSPPLTLAVIDRPVQNSQRATPFCVETQNIAPGAFVHFGMIGFPDPGISLAPQGFPASCTLYLSSYVPRVTVFGPPSAPAPASYEWCPATLPPVAAAPFAGFEFTVQAITVSFGGVDLTARASNAIDCAIGTQ